MSYAAQALFDATALFGLVPEEVLPLGKFFLLGLRTLDGFQRIGVIAGVPCFGRNGHRCWCEVLYLFQLEVQMFGEYGKLRHVGLRAARMAGDEVGDDLLVESFLPIDTVEDTFEVVELLEGRLPHQLEHVVTGMFGGHFEASTDVAGNEFAGIFLSSTVGGLVFAAVEQ